VNGASAALGSVTSDMSAGQAQMIAKEVNE
jgi:hypothetical protein